MDEPNYELPAWLPWATTACLAALVACLGGALDFIEKSRAELLREQAELAESAVMAAQNQLEAERILDAWQLRGPRRQRPVPEASLQVILLGPTEPGAPARGVAVLDPASGRGTAEPLRRIPARAPERDFQLWVDGPGPGYPASCAESSIRGPGPAAAKP
jgi:hypothetical protein